MDNWQHERKEELCDNYEISVGSISDLGILVGVSLGEFVLHPDFCDVEWLDNRELLVSSYVSIQ